MGVFIIAGWKRNNFFLSAAEFSCPAVEKRKWQMVERDLSPTDRAVCLSPQAFGPFLLFEKLFSELFLELC
jgi:hypothetical protein